MTILKNGDVIIFNYLDKTKILSITKQFIIQGF